MISRLFVILTFLSPLAAQESFERKIVQKLDTYTRSQLPPAVITELEKLASENTPLQPVSSTHTPPLFKAYPHLAQHIPYISLGIYPTPLHVCSKLSKELGVQIVVKQDGVAGPLVDGKPLFSGNKLRKLEFLLADAKVHDCNTVITRGGTGSNHALATTIYAKQLGMNSICILGHQPNAHSVQRNLLLQNYYGAKLRIVPNRTLYNLAIADETMACKEKTGKFPYLIPTGGSCDRGALGYVNAVFELKEQITQGLIAEPDFIFVTAGSFGTVAGLAVGLKAAGLKSHLVAVAIEPEDYPLQIDAETRKLFMETLNLLCASDSSFTHYDFPIEQWSVQRTCESKEYGLYTEEGIAAKKLMLATEQIKLDGTYTAIACAGMLAYIKSNNLQNKTVLFWNTYCGEDFQHLTKDVDYKKLPVVVHRYFEEEVQPLDQN